MGEIDISNSITERLCATGRAFVDACSKVDCWSFNGKKRFENLHFIMKTLPNIRTYENLYIYEARMPMMEGMGDKSYPYARRNDTAFNLKEIGEASEMFFFEEEWMRQYGMFPIREMVAYEFNEESVWEMFLIDEMYRFLPLYWHAGYSAVKYVLSPKDIHNLIEDHSPKGDGNRGIFPINSEEKIQTLLSMESYQPLLPSVRLLSEKDAELSLCVWNEWSGLDHLTYPAHDTGKGIIFDEPQGQNLFKYSCGICF